MRSIILLSLFAIGCHSAIKSTPDPIADSVANYNADKPDLLPTIKADTDEIKSALTEQTGLLNEIKETLKASLVRSEPNGTEVIKSALEPAPAVNASRDAGPVRPETLVELATRLYAKGVSVHMKTEDELRAIDAQLNGGQPVTGAIFQNQRASAITSQRSSVRLIPRGRSVVRWQNNSFGQTCGPNGCPSR